MFASVSKCNMALSPILIATSGVRHEKDTPKILKHTFLVVSPSLTLARQRHLYSQRNY